MTANLMAATTLTPGILASAQLSTTAATSVYTVPASSSAKIATASLCNITAAAVTVSVSVVPSGGTADGTHRVVSGYSLPANDALSLTSLMGGLLMGPGDFISVTVGTANAVDVVITGAVGS